MDIHATIRGNLTDEPEARDLQNGQVIVARVAVNHRKFDRQTQQWAEDGSSFVTVSAFGQLGQNVLRSLHKGMPVIVVGTLRQRTWEKQDGSKGSTWEMKADAVGPDLSFAVVGNIAKSSGGSGSNRPTGDAQQQRTDAREGQARQSHAGGGRSAETSAQGFQPRDDEPPF